jgi:hypothetical protein
MRALDADPQVQSPWRRPIASRVIDQAGVAASLEGGWSPALRSQNIPSIRGVFRND